MRARPPRLRPAEAVVVGDRDRAEADRLRVVEQVADRNRAVVRPGRVHVQVTHDPRSGRRAGRRHARGRRRRRARSAVERVEVAGDGREALALRPRRVPPRRARSRSSSSSARRAAAAAASSGCVCDAGRGGQGGAGGFGLERGGVRCPRSRERRSPPRTGSRRGRRRRGRAARRTRPTSRRGTYGRPESGRRPEQRELPAGQLVEHADHASCHGAFEAAPLERRSPCASVRAEEPCPRRGRGSR